MKGRIQLFYIVLLSTVISVNAQSNSNSKNFNGNKELQELINRAKKAGLNDERIAKFLDLIEKKEKELKEIKNSSSDNSVYGILESPMKRTNTEVKMEFAKKLAELLTKDEYFVILEDEITTATSKLTEKEMTRILKRYDLNREQKQKLYKLIADYYLNESITKAYYVYDKKLKNQKLSALNFYFEKNYKELVGSFGISINNSQTIDSDTFQY